MKKYIWLAGALFLLATSVFFLQKGAVSPQISPYGNQMTNLAIRDNQFRVETVSTPEKTALGLSGRESLCEKCGMLFVFQGEEMRGFWMKDMRFDLDIIWIAGDRIVFMAKNVPHEQGAKTSIRPEPKADKVLELPAGTSDKFGIETGDTVTFK